MQVYEADLVAGAFEEAGIPYIRARAVFLTLPLSAQIPPESWTSQVHPEAASFVRGSAWIGLAAMGDWLVSLVFTPCSTGRT